MKTNEYIGTWIGVSYLRREIQIGDLVIMETFDDAIVVEVSKIADNKLWHHNNWIIPKEQIVAVKSDLKGLDT